jgi:hypothetical protein
LAEEERRTDGWIEGGMKMITDGVEGCEEVLQEKSHERSL